jgi:hypothetical protein
MPSVNESAHPGDVVDLLDFQKRNDEVQTFFAGCATKPLMPQQVLNEEGSADSMKDADVRAAIGGHDEQRQHRHRVARKMESFGAHHASLAMRRFVLSLPSD